MGKLKTRQLWPYLYLSFFNLAADEQLDLSSMVPAPLPFLIGAPLHLSTVTRTSWKELETKNTILRVN